MPEVTNDRAHNPEARRDVDHGITITEVHLPAGTPLRASCLCGWESPIVPSRPGAAAEGEQHLLVARATSAVIAEELDRRGESTWLTWDDEAGTVGVCRLPWMSDKQWASVRDATVAAAHVAATARSDDAAAVPAATGKPLAVWQTEPCPPWCVIEHPDDEHPEDRDHVGEIRFVGLRSYPAVKWGADNWELPRWGTYLRAPAAGVEPVVYTFSDEIASGSLLAVEMHLDEAKQLVSTLLATIAEAGDPAEVTR